VSVRTEIVEGAHFHPSTSWAYRGASGTGNKLQASEDEEGISKYSGQPDLVDRDYKEHCASYPSDGRSEQFVEHVQLDVKIQAVVCSI
jgi:hypothetical protein